MSTTLEIQYSRKKQMGFLFLGILLIIIGGLRFMNIQFLFLNFSVVLSSIFLAVGAFLSIVIVFLMKQQSGPVMVLNNEGLLYNPKTKGFVKWNEIERYTDYSMNGVHSILIHLKDVDAFIKKQKNDSTQKAMKRAVAIHNAPIVINTHFLEISANGLKEEIHKHLVERGSSSA